jgi:hypothetical protein
MYVAGGILMQAWSCFGRRAPAAGPPAPGPGCGGRSLRGRGRRFSRRHLSKLSDESRQIRRPSHAAAPIDRPGDATYAVAWRDYRTRAHVTGTALVVWIVTHAGVWLLGARSAELIFFVTTGATIIAIAWYQSWPCPRCSRPYFAKYRRRGNPFTRQCLHCGLGKWT